MVKPQFSPGNTHKHLFGIIFFNVQSLCTSFILFVNLLSFNLDDLCY